MEARINGSRIKALVDTGACCSIAKHSVIQKSLLSAANVLQPVTESETLRAVTGDSLPVVGSVTLDVGLGAVSVRQTFFVVEHLSLPSELILGQDFFHNNEVILSSQPPFLKVNGSDVPILKAAERTIGTVVPDAATSPTVLQTRCRQSDAATVNGHGSESVNCGVEDCDSDDVRNHSCEEKDYMDVSEGNDASRVRKLKVKVTENVLIPANSVGHRQMCVRFKMEEWENRDAFFEPKEGADEAKIFFPGVVKLERSEARPDTAVFRLPYVNWDSDLVAVLATRCIGYVTFLESATVESGTQGTARVAASISKGDGRRKADERKEQLYNLVDVKFPNADSKENKALKMLVDRHPCAFSLPDEPLSVTSEYFHEIVTDGPPVYKKPYPIPVKYHEELKRQMEDMVARGIVRPSRSPYNSPLVLVVKRDGGCRICLDFRGLNAQIPDDRHPIPSIQTILNQLGKSRIFSCLDLRQGYHQIPLTEDSCKKTAFATPDGQMEFLVLPMGLKDAAQTFQRVMNQVLSGLVGRISYVYLDDIVVTGRNFEEHVHNLDEVLDRLDKANLSLKLEKCSFFQDKVDYLGHVVSAEGVRPQPQKVAAMRQFPLPQTLRELQQFLGLANYYRRFVSSYSKIAKPLTDMTQGCKEVKNAKKLLVWNEEARNAFETLKAKLSDDIVLKYPDFSKDFVLTCDASDYAIGGVLQQVDDQGNLRPLSYFSRKLNSAELNYSTIEREALAIVFGLRTNRQLIGGFKVRILTDHAPLTWLFGIKEPNGRVARWQVAVSEFNILVEHLPGRMNFVADALSRVRMSGDTEPVVASVQKNSEVVDEIEWDVTRLAQSQNAHPVWSKVSSFLKGEIKEPPRLSVPVAQFRLADDGLLYRMRENAYGQTYHQVVVTEDFVQAALRLAHSLPTSGHGGVAATLARLNKFAYWPRMQGDVRSYCKSCEVCAKTKSRRDVRVPLLKYPDVSVPFERVHMDLIGPLNSSSDGNKYVVCVVDVLTRYVIAAPIRNKEATTVAEALVKSVVSVHGAPRQIVTDNGSEFVNKVLEELCKTLKVSHTTTTPYHPSSNGIVERANGTIVKILRSLASDNPDIWDDMLPLAVFAYNTGYNRSIKESPYYLMFHRDPVFPFDLLTATPNPWYNVDDYVAKSAVIANRVLKRCKEYLDCANDEQVRFRGPTTVKPVDVGDRVFVTDHARKSKLSPLYKGPYRVIDKVSDAVFKVRHILGGRVSTMHVDSLRKEDNLTRKDNGNVRAAFPVNESDGQKDGTRADSQPSQGYALRSRSVKH